ncbi:TPA: hypothetical protein I7787_21240 [Vibrio vulnificus]|nr:hypothetical protein [Vibrio vulnificus]HAS8618215.1 hypothetical protein [Vibrio vulnificus]
MEQVDITDENKQEFIKALNLKLVTQEGFHKDFLITDLIINQNPILVITTDCTKEQTSDRNSLIHKIFKDCNVDLVFKVI